MLLESAMWEDVISCNQTQASYDRFLNKIEILINKCTKYINVKNKSYKIKLWITYRTHQFHFIS